MVLRHGQLYVCERLSSQGGVKALVGTGRHVNVGGAATGPPGTVKQVRRRLRGLRLRQRGPGDEMSRAQGRVRSKDQCKPGTREGILGSRRDLAPQSQQETLAGH